MADSVPSRQPADTPVCGPFRVVTEDHAARERCSRWLNGTRLAWPSLLVLEVTVASTCPLAPDPREQFLQSDVWIQGSADAPTRATWREWPAVADVDPEASRATLWLSPEALAHFDDGERSFLLVLLALLLRRQGWYHLHSAVLQDPQGRGWVLTGNSGCGKSTTTAWLARNGWLVATDDIAFLSLTAEGPRVHGAYAHIALRDGGRRLLDRQDGEVFAARGKQGFMPHNLGSHWVPTVTPSVIAFPVLGERTAAYPCPPRRALSSLVLWSHWMLYEPMFAQSHLDALGQLAAHSRHVDLHLAPDLFDHPHLLESLVA